MYQRISISNGNFAHGIHTNGNGFLTQQVAKLSAIAFGNSQALDAMLVPISQLTLNGTEFVEAEKEI